MEALEDTRGQTRDYSIRSQSTKATDVSIYVPLIYPYHNGASYMCSVTHDVTVALPIAAMGILTVGYIAEGICVCTCSLRPVPTVKLNTSTVLLRTSYSISATRYVARGAYSEPCSVFCS